MAEREEDHHTSEGQAFHHQLLIGSANKLHQILNWVVGCRILNKDIKKENVIIKKMSNYIVWLHNYLDSDSHIS